MSVEDLLKRAKPCSECAVTKPLEDYAPDARTRDGKQACKVSSERQRDRTRDIEAVSSVFSVSLAARLGSRSWLASGVSSPPRTQLQGHSGPALASNLFAPSTLRMVFTYPANAKADGAIMIYRSFW